jgi:hypothetical protein
MKRYKFTCPDDVRDFIEELVADGLTFHLDDDPEDIVWLDGDLTKEDLYCLKLNMIALWNYCDPWQVLEFYPDTWKKYANNEEEV